MKPNLSNLGEPNDHIALAARCSTASGPDRDIDLAISVAINFKGVFGRREWEWGPWGDAVVSPAGGTLDPAQFVPRWTDSIDYARLLAKTCLGTDGFEIEWAERYFRGTTASRARVISAKFHQSANGANAALALCTLVFSLSNAARKLPTLAGAEA